MAKYLHMHTQIQLNLDEVSSKNGSFCQEEKKFLSFIFYSSPQYINILSVDDTSDLNIDFSYK